MINAILVGVLGNGAYELIKGLLRKYFDQTNDELTQKVYSAFEKASVLFFSKYGDTFGSHNESFLARQENWDRVVQALFYNGPELVPEALNWEGFRGAPTATHQAVAFFIEVVKSEMLKDHYLNKTLAEINHIRTTEKFLKEIKTELKGLVALQREQSFQDSNLPQTDKETLQESPVKSGSKSAPSLSTVLNEEYELTWGQWQSILNQAKNSSSKTKTLLGKALVKVASDLNEDPDVRARAIFCLQEMEAFDQAAEILGYIRDPERSVRSYAAIAVGALKISEGYNQLIQILRNSNEDLMVRDSAAIGLHLLGKREACEELLKSVEAGGLDAGAFGYKALSALADLDTEAAYYDRVLPLLKHPEFNVRSAAARYFEKHIVPDAIDPLIQGLDDPEESPASCMAEALERHVGIMRQRQNLNALNKINEYLQHYQNVEFINLPIPWRGFSFNRLKRLLSEQATK